MGGEEVGEREEEFDYEEEIKLDCLDEVGGRVKGGEGVRDVRVGVGV